jgi:hypothetical protein
MGCLKSKTQNYFKKDIKIEFADKRSQITRLYQLLIIIDEQILNLKDNSESEKKENKIKEISLSLFRTAKNQIKSRACYYAQLIIFIKWLIKIVQVNNEDRRIDFVIDTVHNLIDNHDEFILNSLENKVKHLIITSSNK